MSIRTQAPNYQCQTSRNDPVGFSVNTDTSSKLSMSNQQERSCRLQCQHRYKLQTINVKSMGTISSACMFQGGTNCFLTLFKMEYIPTRNLCYRLIYIFKRFAQIYIIVVKLITLCSQSNCRTSFEQLRISAIRFTDKVQRNLSRLCPGVFITYLRHPSHRRSECRVS